MAQIWYWHPASTAIASVGLAGLCFTAIPASAQIAPDQTLGTESSIVSPNVTVRGLPADVIQGGATRGVNLFHSFSQFNVQDGQRVYFANPIAIETILSRVTGTDPSRIFGTLGVNGTANLFLINPNGILFGANARLDVAGSFLASTANGFKFPDGSEFSATNPQAPPLLTMNITPGLQTGSLTTGATIANRGNLTAGEDLILEATHLDLQGQLVAGRDLTLKAQDTVKIRDTVTTPFLAQSSKDLLILGNQSIDILALNHRGAAFQSGRNLTLVSDGSISGDAHFASNGRFSVLTLQDKPGTLVSKYDPIISVNGDAILGNYTGASLKVEATGDIQIGNVVITAPDVGLTGSDPDIPILTGGSALILRSGLTQLTNPPAPYIITNLGTLGGNFSVATGINAAGQVVGTSRDAAGNQRAFRTAANAAINPLTDNLGTLGGIFFSVATGINAAGQVVGHSRDTSDFTGISQAFRTAANAVINPLTDNLGPPGGDLIFPRGINAAGQVVVNSDLDGRSFRTAPNAAINPLTDDIGTLAGNETDATGINAAGQVAGASKDAAGNFRAFRTAPNAAINPLTDDLGTFGGNFSAAFGINASGQVVGYSTDATGNFRAFRTAPNGLINPLTDNLGTLGGNQSLAESINANGQVVGNSTDAAGNRRAFLYDNGLMIDLNTRIPNGSGWTLKFGKNINDSGQIVGNGVIDGQDRAFLLTPLPAINAGGVGTLTVGNVSQAGGDPLTVILAANSDLQTGNIITNGGDIRIASSATFRVTNSTLSSGTAGNGRAGDITIQATNLELLDGSKLITETLGTDDGGNINLSVRDTLLLRRTSLISTTAGTAQAGGKGGNITINAGFIVAVLSENSDITTNAFAGSGGNITITTNRIFGLEFQPTLTPFSDITTSARLGINGTARFILLDVDPNQRTTLPRLSDTLNLSDSSQNVVFACSRRTKGDKFVVLGNGGVPVGPEDSLGGSEALVALLELRQRSESGSSESGSGGVRGDSRIAPSPDSIIEAQGWVQEPDGTIALVAHAPKAVPANSWLRSLDCDTKNSWNEPGKARSNY